MRSLSDSGKGMRYAVRDFGIGGDFFMTEGDYLAGGSAPSTGSPSYSSWDVANTWNFLGKSGGSGAPKAPEKKTGLAGWVQDFTGGVNNVTTGIGSVVEDIFSMSDPIVKMVDKTGILGLFGKGTAKQYQDSAEEFRQVYLPMTYPGGQGSRFVVDAGAPPQSPTKSAMSPWMLLALALGAGYVLKSR